MNAANQKAESVPDDQVDKSWAAAQTGADLTDGPGKLRAAGVNFGIAALLDGDEIIVNRIDALQRRVEIAEGAIRETKDCHLVCSLASIGESLARIADAMAPKPADIVDSPYVAEKLDCTKTWIAEMARSGEIPAPCIVAGTGNGRPWKFYRAKIDEWIESR